MSEVSGFQPFVAAFEAGLSPIPVDTTTKRPLLAWKAFQSERADLLQCQEWEGLNIGVVCGEVSGRLICLDFEAGFMDQLPEFVERLKADEIYMTLYGWIGGYCESTPSGGMHVLLRLEGEGSLPGNTKLASDPSGKTLVETRAEGGYVIVAPSRNGTRGWELLHGSFDRIAYATLAEWDAVVAVIRTFDSAPPPPTAATPVLSLPSILRLGDSWVDDELARLPNIRTVLSAIGWEPEGGRDNYGEHWVRPGKDARQGHSASVSAADRLFVHSTNAGLPTGNPTLDVLDVILANQLGRRPSPDERVEYLRAQRPPAERGAGAALGGGTEVADPSVRLDDAFWEARPWLSQLRDVARSRMLAADGVLGAFLSCYAATVPMGIWVPGVVARRAPLNIYSCLVAGSGGGKTGAMGLALDLLGWNVSTNPHVLLNQSLRSGEGLPRLVVIPTKRGEEDLGPRFHNAVQISFDEGGTLGKQSERSGSTIIPYLNTAWAGSGTVGGAKAMEVVQFPAELVRICAVMGVQYGAAANLFTGESAALGFPQRLAYFGLVDDSLSMVDVDTMDFESVSPLGVRFWDHAEFSKAAYYIDVPANIQREVRLWARDAMHGGKLLEALDSHLMNLRLRIASICSLIDDRGGINDADWDLAGQVTLHSRQIRQQLIASLGELSMQRTQGRINEAVMTADALDDRWLRRRAARIARFVHSQSEGCTLKDIKSRLAQDERPRRSEILDRAEQLDWITATEGRYFGGGSKPA